MKGAHTEGVRRIVELDILRGIGIFSVILIHSTILYYSHPIASFVWDANQYAVQLLVFCSSYIYFIKEKSNASFSFTWYFKKRILRLLQPYYIFAAVYFVILAIFQKSQLNLDYIKQSVFLTGGISINWLVLLMLQFAIAYPFISFLKNRFKPGFYMVCVLSLLSSIWLLFFKLNFDYKLVMWLPWLTIAFYSLLFVKYQKNTKFLFVMFFLSLLVFACIRMGLTHFGHSLQMYDNKYPPNIYFLVYGMMIIPFLLLLSYFHVFSWKPIEKFLAFLSKNSFTLFFIHFLFLYFFTKYGLQHVVSWYVFFGALLFLSVAAQFIFDESMKRLFKDKDTVIAQTLPPS